ncbi:ATP phosphoribosyltransferase [Pseudahrensia aquimaris]|uniref:ATP phosphoribosyltransferase n=1 Tax=Pseudahrensia aquimaris TaxID=744461 RepID=A0ABW3FIG0_9HYPH
MNLHIAIPSKGRLKEATLVRFAGAGLVIEPSTDARSYQASMKGRSNIDVSFLSASEIARELANGSIHMGVTGEDLARETLANADDAFGFPVKLGFGHADVVVAVPEAWIDVDTMADLDDVAAQYRSRIGRRLRIATKYWQLTQHHFRTHGIGVYRIVESLGATEGAPAAGSADVIVDITSTGSTIRANHLKILSDGVILKSEANLVESKRAVWGKVSRNAADEIIAALQSV